uniref:LRRNT domain-containing protein n=1 Tax=Athene cunicularia TaxID=194338 RepID=A0A663MJY1_ATHCN
MGFWGPKPISGCSVYLQTCWAQAAPWQGQHALGVPCVSPTGINFYNSETAQGLSREEVPPGQSTPPPTDCNARGSPIQKVHALFPAFFSTICQVLDAVADLWLVMFFPVMFLFICAAKVGLSLNISDSCPSMCKCSPEEIIHCSGAGLSALPEEIAASTISLNLSNNYLRILTTTTFRNLTSLHSLWLDGNNLTFLSPGSFHTLSKLRELHLSRNSRLAYLHANTFRGLSSLISLDLSHCNIFEIHPLLFSHLSSLERLNLASNNMRYFPQAFRNLSSLTRLSLEGNHIEAIGRDSLKDLETLHDLNLRKNHIWIIQNGAFTKLLRLSMLNLGHNFIAALPNQLFDGLIQLKTMHLEANRITAVNYSAFSYLNKLHFLHLSKNNLSSLPIHLFAELPKLKYVFLSHNPWKCDCRMRWFWQGTTTHRGVIRGLHCDFLGPDNMTVLNVPHPGDPTDCTVPSELASEDKCRWAKMSPSKTFYQYCEEQLNKPQLTWLCIYPCKELIYLRGGLYELSPCMLLMSLS